MINKEVSIGDRIKYLRTHNGYTQEGLAKKLGLKGKSSIANYENGQNSPSDSIKLALCELFNCSMDYLMGKTDFYSKEQLLNQLSENFFKDKYIIKELDSLTKNGLTYSQAKDFLKTIINIKTEYPNESESRIKDYISQYDTDIIDYLNFFVGNFFDNFSFEVNEDSIYFINKITGVLSKIKIDSSPKNSPKFYMCPVYGRIAAGQPNWAEECIEGRIPIDPVLMDIINPEECYFLKVNGESMNKVIRNGAYALIRKTDWVKNGEIAVVLVNGYDATLKKFTKQGNLVILEPMSDDPSFETQVYDKSTEIRVIGKYIGKFETNY